MKLETPGRALLLAHIGGDAKPELQFSELELRYYDHCARQRGRPSRFVAGHAYNTRLGVGCGISSVCEFAIYENLRVAAHFETAGVLESLAESSGY